MRYNVINQGSQGRTITHCRTALEALAELERCQADGGDCRVVSCEGTILTAERLMLISRIDVGETSAGAARGRSFG